MARVAAYADGLMRVCLARALAASESLEMASDGDAIDAAILAVHTPGDYRAPWCDNAELPVVSLYGNQQFATVHPRWNLSDAQKHRRLSIPTPPLNAMLRVLGALPRAMEISLLITEPAGETEAATKGPVDSIVLLPPATLGPSSWSGPATWSIHSIRVPHTLCWLVHCEIRLEEETTYQIVVRELEAQPLVFMVDEDLGFDSTAAVVEYFRDRGSPCGAFSETVVYRKSLSVQRRTVRMDYACHFACQLPEAIEITSRLTGGNSFKYDYKSKRPLESRYTC